MAKTGGLTRPLMKASLLAACLVASRANLTGSSGCVWSQGDTADGAACLPVDLDVTKVPEYLIFANNVQTCSGRQVRSGTSFDGCEAPPLPICKDVTLPDLPDITFCFPDSFTTTTTAAVFSPLSEQFIACATATPAPPDCRAVRVEYYTVMGCDVCGDVEQDLLEGIDRCGGTAATAATCGDGTAGGVTTVNLSAESPDAGGEIVVGDGDIVVGADSPDAGGEIVVGDGDIVVGDDGVTIDGMPVSADSPGVVQDVDNSVTIGNGDIVVNGVPVSADAPVGDGDIVVGSGGVTIDGVPVGADADTPVGEGNVVVTNGGVTIDGVPVSADAPVGDGDIVVGSGGVTIDGVPISAESPGVVEDTSVTIGNGDIVVNGMPVAADSPDGVGNIVTSNGDVTIDGMPVAAGPDGVIRIGGDEPAGSPVDGSITSTTTTGDVPAPADTSTTRGGSFGVGDSTVPEAVPPGVDAPPVDGAVDVGDDGADEGDPAEDSDGDAEAPAGLVGVETLESGAPGASGAGMGGILAAAGAAAAMAALLM